MKSEREILKKLEQVVEKFISITNSIGEHDSPSDSQRDEISCLFCMINALAWCVNLEGEMAEITSKIKIVADMRGVMEKV